jgi:hypothetical protein
MEEITEPTIEPTIEPIVEPIVEPTIEPTIEPIKPKQAPAKSPDESYENANIWNLVLLRNIRNNYLNLTDKYLLPDYPIQIEQREVIRVYRQMLRDIINLNREAVLNGVSDIEIPPIPI